jgi:cell division protein ZapB
MSVDLAPLENKVEQVVAFCQKLREENHALRSRVAELEADKKRLAEKIDTARGRLEALMDKLPPE